MDLDAVFGKATQPVLLEAEPLQDQGAGKTDKLARSQPKVTRDSLTISLVRLNASIQPFKIAKSG